MPSFAASRLLIHKGGIPPISEDIDELIEQLLPELGLTLPWLLALILILYLKEQIPRFEIRLVPVYVIIAENSTDPPSRGIGLIDLNDRNMYLARIIFWLHPNSRLSAINIMNLNGSLKKCLINLNQLTLYENEVIRIIEYTASFINNDELIRTHVVSPAWDIFLHWTRRFNITVRTGVGEDEIIVNENSLEFATNGDRILTVRGTLDMTGPYSIVYL